MSISDDDDFDQSEEAERRIRDKEFDTRANNFYLAGVREALDHVENDESAVQVAFDAGYRDGHRLGRQLGALLHTCTLIEGLYVSKRLVSGGTNLAEHLLQPLKDFNAKILRLHESVPNLIKSGQEVSHEDMEKLRKEAEDILTAIECPREIYECLYCYSD